MKKAEMGAGGYKVSVKSEEIWEPFFGRGIGFSPDTSTQEPGHSPSPQDLPCPGPFLRGPPAEHHGSRRATGTLPRFLGYRSLSFPPGRLTGVFPVSMEIRAAAASPDSGHYSHIKASSPCAPLAPTWDGTTTGHGWPEKVHRLRGR